LSEDLSEDPVIIIISSIDKIAKAYKYLKSYRVNIKYA